MTAPPPLLWIPLLAAAAEAVVAVVVVVVVVVAEPVLLLLFIDAPLAAVGSGGAVDFEEAANNKNRITLSSFIFKVHNW